MSEIIAPVPVQRYVDNNGNALVGGFLYSYAAGSTTPLATYTDSTGNTQQTNPIVLNFRGECSYWLPPNVSYKFNLTDSAGNQIPGWPVDNIVNSQLLSTYGGVDTGNVNAYVINFAANFTSLVDGIQITWIPSHTNTGASTININGLGPINIVNGDGSALAAGEIQANLPAQILIKGGAAILLNSYVTVDVGSITTSFTGISTSGTVDINYVRQGNTVQLHFIQVYTGTSNSTSLALANALPFAIRPSVTCVLPCPYTIFEDNTSVGVANVDCTIQIDGIIFFSKGTSGWTSSGTKGMVGNGLVLTYTLI